jgi:hypothetical protein
MNKLTLRDVFFFFSGLNLMCCIINLLYTNINYFIVALDLIAFLGCLWMGLEE